MLAFLRALPIALISVGLLVTPTAAARKHAPAAHKLTEDSVNNAEWRRGKPSAAVLVRLQSLLDRAHASPGQIDANLGENTRKAIAALQEIRGLGDGQEPDERMLRALVENDREPALVKYTITDKDVAGPFIERVPKDFREKARLKHLSYTGPKELLAEKFHMSENLLQRLNPGVSLDQAGAPIGMPWSSPGT